MRINGQSRVARVASREEALVALAGWAEELGIERPPPRTMAEVLDAYVKHSARNRSESTQASVEQIVRTFLLPHMGHWDPSSVTPGRLEQLYDRLTVSRRSGRDHPISDGTRRHVHYVVLPALALAKRWRWIPYNPAEDVDLGPLRRKQVVLPNEAQQAILLEAAASDSVLGPFLRLAIATGARRGEISGLQRGDIDWANGSLVIGRSLAEVRRRDGGKGNEIVVVPPKTVRSQRSVKLDFDTLGILQRHLTRLEDQGCSDSPIHWVFPDLRRELTGIIPDRPSAWSTRFSRLKKELGLDMRLHDIRHLHASWLLADKTVELIHLSARLGHARTSTTQDVYGHFLPASAADEAAALAIGVRLRRSWVEEPPSR